MEEQNIYKPIEYPTYNGKPFAVKTTASQVNVEAMAKTLDVVLSEMGVNVTAVDTKAGNAQATANQALTLAQNAMPKTGGDFTGRVSVPASTTVYGVMNSRVLNSAQSEVLAGYVYVDFILK